MRVNKPSSKVALAVLVFALSASAGCGAKSGLGSPDGAPPPPPRPDATVDSAVPPIDSGVVDSAPDALPPPDAEPRPCRIPAPVDLLLVIDDSGSMFEEQQNLARELPKLIGDLIAPPDADDDGRPDWRAVRDVHMGIVTTSIAGLEAICDGSGDDGILRSVPGAGLAGCADSYPSFLTFRPGDDPEAASMDFACVARVGTEGCGLEQPLEAALKALLPEDSPFDFLAGRPHGDVENAGFLRDDSLLAVVILTDEDDCSTFDPTLFDDFVPGPGSIPPCLRDTDPLYSIDRYEEAFRSLRPDRPDLFSFAVIGGIPEIVVSDPLMIDFEAVRTHPRMQVRFDADGRLIEACRGRGGSGFPARRLVELAERFGDQATLGSVCAESFTPTVGGIARQVGLRACEEFDD